MVYLLEDLASIDKEIFYNSFVIFENNPQKVDLTKMSVYDPFVSKVWSESFDFILRTQRDFLKNMSASETAKICSVLVLILAEMETRVIKLQNLQPTNLDESSKYLLTCVKTDSDEILRECLIRLLAQVCQENVSCIDETTIQEIFVYVKDIAFLPPTVFSHQKNAQTSS